MAGVSRWPKSQQEKPYVVDENIGREEMSENRQALNKVLGNLANLDVKLGNITQALERGVISWTICTITFTVKIPLHRQ